MKKALYAAMICAVMMMAGHGTSARADDGTTEALLQSTELLLISQATLSYLSIGLVDTNMEHDYTTNDEDRDSLGTIMDSLSLGQETIKALSGSNVIADEDLEFIKSMGKVNDNLIKATGELQKFCDDSDAGHFDKAANYLIEANKFLEKATNMLQ